MFQIQVSGVLRRGDLQEAQAAAAREIGGLGAIRLLSVLEAFEGREEGADWSDLAFYEAHDSHIERIAIVGDERWRDGSLAFAGGSLRRAAVRFFPAAEHARARAWLREDDRSTSRG